MLSEWLPAYESDHRWIDADGRQSQLETSTQTLDRLLRPYHKNDNAHTLSSATTPT